MKTFAVLGLLLGVMAMLAIAPPQRKGEGAHAAHVAGNFVIFRNAALAYVHKHKTVQGEVPTRLLTLPTGWRAARAWQARVEAGRCYVWGEATAEEIAAVQELLLGSYAVGWSASGVLLPGHGVSIAVPGFIPDHSLVSVTVVP